ISAPAEYVWSRHLMERVNNTVRLKVWKGFIVGGRKGPNRLPPPHLQARSYSSSDNCRNRLLG
ncbi:hypothetical protein, partial [Mesorhizobium sp. M0771]|uniref:hypothetical protein n=1 Tax=Mesorhizobium sp. M0771 TaxID=2956997 RepID=UPI003339DFC0